MQPLFWFCLENTGVIEFRWCDEEKRGEAGEYEGMYARLKTYMYTLMLADAPLLPLHRRVHTRNIHLWLQPLSAKCQPDKSQGLRVKWNINILTNRAESQEYRAQLSHQWWLHFCLTLLQFALRSGEYQCECFFWTLKYLSRLQPSSFPGVESRCRAVIHGRFGLCETQQSWLENSADPMHCYHWQLPTAYRLCRLRVYISSHMSNEDFFLLHSDCIMTCSATPHDRCQNNQNQVLILIMSALIWLWVSCLIVLL